jgi:hypothetical protein
MVLQHGILIEFDTLGLIHFPEGPDEDIGFLSSHKPKCA